MDLRLGTAAVLAVILGLSGCTSSQAADDLPAEPAAREQALAESLSLRDPRMGAEQGSAFLEVTITNPGSSSVSARCAPEWYDAKGQIVATASAWESIQLAAGEERRVRFSGAPANARSWRLRFTR